MIGCKMVIVSTAYLCWFSSLLTLRAAVEALPALFAGTDGFGDRPAEDRQLERLESSSSAAQVSQQDDAPEMIDILGLAEHDLDLDPEKYLEEAAAILDDLSDLRSTLLDPYDDDDPGSPLNADQLELVDREYIQRAFTQAKPFLIGRLLAANRRRRRNMHHLKQAAEGFTNNAGGNLTVPSSVNKPRVYPRSVAFRGYTRSKAFSSEAGASKTVPSTKDAKGSQLSFVKDEIDSMTSLTSGGNTGSLSIMPELHPPGPPINISIDKNLPFPCQYCSFDVPLDSELHKREMVLDDWISHFYLDLQPYVCTFEGCSRGHKLFGRKQDWFQHELDYHRMRQVWYCANTSCQTEFETLELFKGHLQANHPEVILQTAPDFLAIFIETCQRLSLAPQVPAQQQCLLCGAAYKEAQVEWKDHLAHHLEQFALLAIGEDEEGSSVEEEIDKVKTTTEFVLEMEARYAPKPERTPLANQEPVTAVQDSLSLRPGDSNDPQHVSEGTNDLGDSGGEGHRREQAEPLWEEKVEDFLKEEPTEVADTIWLHVPNQNDDFVGRDNDLNSLNEYISQPGHICVVSGRGGIGKTATAVEYARRYEGNYSAVIWIEAERPGGLSDKYNSIGTEIFKLSSETRHDSLMIEIRTMLERWEQRWLLIFDNAESWEDIARYIPRNLPKTKGSILITTRQQDLIHMGSRPLQRVLRRIELQPLTTEEGAQFLIRSIDPQFPPEDIRSHRDYDDAAKAADLVERLPLALIMVAGFAGSAKSSTPTLEEFLELWEEKSAFRAKHARRNQLVTEGGLDSSIDLLWDIGISELSVPARNLLEILAFLDPENIQKELLVGDHTEEFLEFLNSTETTQYKRMVRQLTRRKLIEIKQQPAVGGVGESYRIHRLLQQKIIFDMGAQLKLDGAITKATRLIRKLFPHASPIQAPAPQNSARCKEYMPHVFSLLRAFKEANEMYPDVEKSEEMADLFYDAGFYVWDSQDTEQGGLDLLNAAELILDSEWIEMDEMHPRRADIHCISGLLRNTMGCQERDESSRRLKLALDIRKHVYQNTKPYERDVDVLLQNAAVDYGIMLINKYQFEEAEAILEECLLHYRDWGSEDKIPFEYSKYYYNMGVVRLCQGQLDEAISHLRQSVDLVEAFNGKQGQYWDNYFMLACATRHSGDFYGALEMHREILQARLEQLGKHSNATILSTYAVAEVHIYLGDLQNAMSAYLLLILQSWPPC